MNKTIAVLMTCYNRRETTLVCLDRLYSQKLPDSVSFKVFLVDDGCTDGSGGAVKTAHPDITVISGGALFWCNGMRLAWEHAAKNDPDFYLWLNDDSMLLDGAIERLLGTYREVCRANNEPMSGPVLDPNLQSENSKPQSAIIVGSCCDPETGEHTYGGQRRLGRHPGKVARITPKDVPLECDTFEGNVVLVSREVYQKNGSLDHFSHAMGDTDYGYRAKRVGCRAWIVPGFVGECCDNPMAVEALSNTRSVLERWRFRISNKGLPPRDWFKFLIRHAGWRGGGYFVASYLKVFFR